MNILNSRQDYLSNELRDDEQYLKANNGGHICAGSQLASRVQLNPLVHMIESRALKSEVPRKRQPLPLARDSRCSVLYRKLLDYWCQ